jgi:hypothetical protein
MISTACQFDSKWPRHGMNIDWNLESWQFRPQISAIGAILFMVSGDSIGSTKFVVEIPPVCAVAAG